MIDIHYSKIRNFSIVLLAIPSLIFFLFWLRPVVSIPATILLVAAIILAWKTEDKILKVSKSSLLILGAIVLVWILLSGQGRFFTQTPDHFIRNAVLRDMINYKWPVRYEGTGDESLVYYIGFWLVPAAVGKLFTFIAGFKTGYLLSRIALCAWSFAFIYLSVLLICFKLNKNTLKNILIIVSVFIFFSGMDSIGTLIMRNTDNHIENWAILYVYSSMSTQLMDAFNQTVPAWLAMSLVINEKNEKAYALIGLLLLSTSPLPLFGMACYLLYLAIKRLITAGNKSELTSKIKTIVSPTNIISVIVLPVIYWIYYDNNIAIGSGITVSTSTHYDAPPLITAILIYVAFILLEFGILLLLITNKKNRADSIFIAVTLVIIPFLHIGWMTDFCMRVSIPMLYVLMVMLMEFFVSEDSKRNRIKFDLVLAVFLIGALTAVSLYISATQEFILTHGESAKTYDTYNGLADLPLEDKGNSVGVDSDSTPFFRYLAKK